MPISITVLADQLSVSPGVVKTLVDHFGPTAEGHYTVDGKLADAVAAGVRLQLNLSCERRIPELYLG
jgi:hypothetical protein